MKKIILLMIGATSFVACQKENVASPNSNPIGANLGNEKDIRVDFNYSLMDDPSCFHCYWCTAPKVDCSKLIISGSMSKTALAQEAALDVAIANKTVSSFFSLKSNWDQILPNLVTQTDWLDQLIKGTVTLTKKINSTYGQTLYIGIAPSIDPNNFLAKDVSFATALVNG